MSFAELRRDYHRQLCERIFFLDAQGIPNNADKHSSISVELGTGILKKIGFPLSQKKPSGQTSGAIFQEITLHFLEKSFQYLQHLRPGNWIFRIGTHIEQFEQYEHLADLAKTLKEHKKLLATLGDYLINPDIVIGRRPVGDDEINLNEKLIAGEQAANLTPLREKNSPKPILHASISCKWTIRSDRSQNARTEGLNLIRNRKGKTPHIVIVTAEPYPQRIASLALGTGDIDCLYHFALPELQSAVEEYNNPAVLEMFDILVSGKRLRDISDLPFDLAI